MKINWTLGSLVRLFGVRPPPRDSKNELRPGVRSERQKSRCDLSEGSSQAIERLKKAAADGDPVAQNQVGLRMTAGTGLLEGDQEARNWLRRAAQQGYSEAQFNLGNLCQSASLRTSSTGAGEARTEAYAWFQLAAAQGHAQAAASSEMLNLQLTDAELAEGNRRVHAFECRKEVPDQGESPTSRWD